jgi:membrane-bound lytic murein transglycosylase F
VRLLRRTVLFAAALAIAVGLALFQARDRRAPLVSPEEAHELVVMIRPGPVVYFPGPEGTPAGFEVELARLFAADSKVALRILLADSTSEVIAAVAEGRAHLGAGGLYRPSPGSVDRHDLPSSAASSNVAPTPEVAWTIGYATVEPVLIYNHDGYKPSNWADLDGETVAYVDDVGFEAEIAAARSEHRGIKWQRLALPAAGLISQVSDGTVSYAIVGSVAAAVARNIYLDYEVGFPAGSRRDVAWAVSPRFPEILQELDRFLARLERDGTLARLAERYVPSTRKLLRLDASVLQERVRTLLPQYRTMFHDAQERTGIEWRLLAAIAYQESQWDPAATSETGVRGIMQITEDTARRLGIRNLLDPAECVLGAARYLRELNDKLPARIPEPERTWLALAAFNIGQGHLEDARILAQRQKLNPDTWSDVKKVLPLLALPEFYGDAKQGYARGGMPVAFVDRVRGYYDVLLAREAPHQPRLRIDADASDHGLVRRASDFVKK